MELIKSESGMTLIELMVAIVIAAVITLGFSELIYNSSKSQANIKTKGDLNELHSQVKKAANDPNVVLFIERQFND